MDASEAKANCTGLHVCSIVLPAEGNVGIGVSKVGSVQGRKNKDSQFCAGGREVPDPFWI